MKASSTISGVIAPYEHGTLVAIMVIEESTVLGVFKHSIYSFVLVMEANFKYRILSSIRLGT